MFQQQRTVSDITTIADAEVRTAEILSRFSQPFLLGDLLVRSSSDIDVNLGDLVTIVDDISTPNINKTLVVTKQILKYPGSNQELEVGDESIRLADWQIDVDSRLKRIEESLSLTNQDLILELIDIQETVTAEPRYIQVLEANIAGNSLIWGSASFGILGTAKWGGTTNISFVLGNVDAAILGTSELGSQVSEPTTHFISQYEDEYGENFADDDFKDSATTADWDNLNKELNM